MSGKSMFSRILVISLLFVLLVSLPMANAQSLIDPVDATILDDTENGIKAGVLTVGFEPFETVKEPEVAGNDLITATSYVYSTSTGVALEDMSSGTTQLVGGGADDTASAVTNIGFDFVYDGVRHSQFSINVNGLMRLGSTAVGTTFNNSTDGLGTVTNAPKIAPYFEDLCTGSTGGVRYKVVGTAPNRKLVVEWFGMEVPRDGSCSILPQTGVFQLWLFESAGSTTPGQIQFVYGGGMNPSTATDLGASVGLQSGVATNFASVTLSDDTVSYVAANNVNLTGVASGKSYIFTPANTPAAPSGLNFTSVGPTSQTLNWTDNSTNELAFGIFRSTDGINYTFAGQTAADAVSFTDTLLTPSTNYFYRVQAFAEGISSAALSGSSSTLAGGSISCAGAGGNWSDTAAWMGGVVPTANDNVTIPTGCTITVDTATATALNVTIDAGGTLQSPLTGTVVTNNLTVIGNVVNNGTLDFSTNADTSGAILTFGAGGFNTTFGGTGATTDVRSVVVAKGTQGVVVDMNPTNFTVLGVNTDSAGFLTLTSGTFKVSGTFTATNRVFTAAAYTIPALGAFWLNNPNFTVAGQNGSPTNSGLLRISSGIYNVGTATGNSMGGTAGAVFTIEGGTLNTAGRLQTTSAVTYNQSGGDVNVCTVGNTATTACFGLTSTTNTFNMSGGNITLVTPSGSATPLDYSVSTSASVVFVTNPVTTVLNVGTGAAAQTFRVLGSTPSLNIPANKTMNVGSGTAGGAIFHRGATVINNGIIAIQGTGTSSRFDFAASGPMTYGGAGIFGTAAVPFAGVGMSANSPTGNNTTINSPIFINRVNFFSGGFVGSGNITFGDGLASASVIQTGNSTTATNAGTFDVSPNFNIGSGGHILLYLRTTTLNRVTGFEIPPSRTVLTFTHDDNAVGGTLGLSGGNLTVTGVMTLTNGVTLTGASKIIHNGTAARTNGFIDGNLERSYPGSGSYTYFVGQNAFSPVVANVTAGTVGSSLMARAVDVPMVGLETNKSLSRHWVLTETGDLTADVSFTYAADAADVNGIETDYRIYKNVGGVITNECSGAPCVNDATNTLGPLVGVTDFNAAWSGGENSIVDTNAPNTSILTNPNNPINSSAATFTFSGTDSLVGIASFQCRIDAGAWETCTSPKTYTGLADGSHTFEVRAIDTAGNPDPTPASYTWVIDTVAPNTTILTNPTNPTTDTNATFTFGATGLGLSYTFECKLDMGSYAPCTSPQSYTGLAVGPHTFDVRATDLAGNVDPTPANYAWTINAAASNVTVTATAGTPGPTNYATLKDAIDAINGGTHQGDITVAINTNTTETAPSVLNSSGAGSALYTSVLIRPSADGVTVAGPTATGRGLIELNGADNVTIDGDNPGSAGTNRNLTIQNTAANTVTFTSVIRVALNTTTVASADNNTFRNLNILGSATGRNISTATSTTGTENTTYGIVAGVNASGATTAPTALTSVTSTIGTGATATNLRVINNSFNSAARAVSVNGSATTVFPGVWVRNNDIGNATAGAADQIYNHGISVQGTADASISGNNIQIEGFVGSSGNAGTVGIACGVLSTNTSCSIQKNKVNRVRNLNGETWAVHGINLGGGNSHVVTNNFVTDLKNSQVAGTGAFSTTFGLFGIRVGAGIGHVITHNSVNLFGPVAGTTSTLLTASIGVVATASTGMDIRNNVFVNTISGGNPSGTRNVAVYFAAGGTSAMNLNWNNNDYFVGADAQNRMAQRGTTFGTGEFTLADFDPTMTTPAANFRSYTSTLSAAGTNDNASLKVDPLFVSNTDLHLQATSPMLELGANAGVGDDIDGDARDSVPDIGADELVAVAVPGVLAFSSATYNVAENAMGGTVAITVSRTGGSDGTVGATYALTNGTATGGASCGAGVDFVNVGGTVTLVNGETSKTFNVAICDDAVFEGNETFNLTLSNPTGGATIGMPSTAAVTINDNEVAAPGSLQFSSATYSVGESGGTVSLTVTRTGGSDGTVAATYSTGGGTASGGVNCLSPGADYAGVTDTVTFLNGETSKNISITICSDTADEANETFDVTLSVPTGGATIGTPNPATVTITDDDPVPSLSIDDLTLNEGNSGTTTFGFTVTLSAASGQQVTVNYSTADGTATAPSDYTASASTPLIFAAGETTKTVNVLVNGDTTNEPNETFFVNLAGAINATISDGQGQGNITNDDVTPGGNFSINDVRVNEGNSGTSTATFTVTYTAGGAASVNFSTANVTATAGSDYVTNNGTLNFPASGSSQTTTVNVTVNGDTAKEANEVFRVNLSGATGGATITDNTGYGVIRDEDRSYFADFDDDLKADYSVHRQSEQRHYVLRSSDGGNIVTNFGLATDVAVPGDYDGDGKTDIALYRPSTSTFYAINSSTNTVKGLTVGAAGDTPVQGDYNGDGRTDLATFRPASGLWSILFINDGTTSAVNFGLAGDRPVQADYDGDAKTDVAVYRDGTWYILRSSDASVSIANWGLPADKPVSGDFDGDGRFDLAIYRNGQWWITYSLNGNTGVIAFGLATDVTAAADYDGDGTTDVAVYRPSAGDWYVLQSSTSTVTGVKWGIATDVPIPNRYLPQ